MEIHKPRPWHGLREFLGEILIIVIGVLIAMSAEQVVESLHWRHKLERAEDHMRAEQADDDLPQAYVRAAAGVCFRDQLRAARAVLDSPAPDRLRFLAAINAYAPPIRTWDAQAWSAVNDSDVASHMSSERRLQWAGVYNIMPRMQNLNWEEDVLLSRLQGTRRLKGVMSDQEVVGLAQDVGRLQALNAVMASDAAALLAAARGANVEVPQQAQTNLDKLLRDRLGACVIRPTPHVSTMNAGPLEDERLPDGDFKIQ